jgi:hypothetical protein
MFFHLWRSRNARETKEPPKKTDRTYPKLMAPPSGPGQPWLHSAISSRPYQSEVEVGAEKIGAVLDQRCVDRKRQIAILPESAPNLALESHGLEHELRAPIIQSAKGGSSAATF